MPIIGTMDDRMEELRDLICRHRYSKASAIYYIIDPLTSRAVLHKRYPFACKMRCAFCCHQLIRATKDEWEEIQRYLEWEGMTTELMDNIEKSTEDWKNYLREPENQAKFEEFKQDPTADPFKLRLFQDWQDKLCPFLDCQDECSIYPVRPLQCRIYRNTIPCFNWERDRPVDQPYEWEVWARVWLLSQSNTIYPLHWWLSNSTL